MANSTIFMLPISMNAFEIMRSLKESEQADSLTDSEFILSLINDPMEGLSNYNSSFKNTVDTFEEFKISKSFCELKKQCEIIPSSLLDIQTVNDSNVNLEYTKIECKDCHEKFSLESELSKHYEIYHVQPNQFKCSCGDNFQCLQLFLQHKFFCSVLKTNLKLEKTNDRKRCWEGNMKEQNMKRVKVYELNCETCGRKFRTSSALYLHECRKTKSDDSHQSNNSPSKMPVSKENIKPIELKSQQVKSFEIKFTCHCTVEFNDYYEYSSHCNKCGKTDVLDSTISSTKRSSPLKILPNDNGKFDCEDCDKSFSSILSLRQHRDEPKYVCKVCGKGYRWCTSFHYHKRKCDSEK